MPDTDRSLPPRPAAARPLGQAAAGWLAWFGVARLVLAAGSVAVVVAGGYWLLRAPQPDTVSALPLATASSQPAATLAPPPAPTPSSTTAPMPVTVHVAGQVRTAGVYTLPAGSRVIAAIEAADGATAEGDLDGLNLAAVLTDGQRVYVPALGEVDPASVPDGAAGASPDGSAVPAGPVDVNTASAEQFETLPGVGPATARAIVDDRQRNGPFASVDELERVPGIGPAKLAALRELVTV